MQTILRLIKKSARFIDQNKYLILLISIILLAAILRLKGLSTRDIWYDEALDVLQAEKSIAQISKDVATPIHYYFVHFFLLFGKNSFILGLPSVIFGVTSVFLLYLIGEKISNKNLGLVSAFLLSISPMHIEFSQQILHYSYFIFFCLLSLYFYLDFILGPKDKKIKWGSLILFILFTGINFLTHVSAFLVVAIEAIYLAYFLLRNCKLVISKIKIKKYIIILVILTVLLIGVIAAKVGGGYYLKLFSQNINFGFNKPIELGFSLSKQLQTTLLSFNKQFFVAMFSWFGIGKGFRLYLYFSLFVLGLLSFVRKRSFSMLLFFLIWIGFPFISLYFIKPSHWFEEKYFIFIIPLYLLIISEGIIFLSKIFTKIVSYLYKFKITPKIINKAFQLVIISLIFWATLKPIQIRTTYGFPVDGHVNYSWRQIFSYLKQNTKEDDRIFIRRGEGLFLDFYFGKNSKNKIWFEEDYILSTNPQEYLKLTQEETTNYFVSIPEFYDSFLADVADYQLVDKVGNFNIYKIKFKKESPLKIEEDKKGNWEYYDDFRTAKYFAEAYNWKNITTTYKGNPNLPITYGYYNLSPTNSSQAWIEYQFNLPSLVKSFYIKPVFSITKGVSFKIFIADDNKKKLKQVFEKTSDSFFYFNPIIKIDKDNFFSEKLFVRIVFDFEPNQNYTLGESSLKSLWLFNNIDRGVNDYDAVTNDDLIEYSYKSGLEVTKSNKWLYDTIQNDGWIQATDGILFRHYGDKEKNPLIYKFSFDQKIDFVNLKSKTYTFNNELYVYKSLDGKSWSLLEKINDNSINIHQFNIDNLNKSKVIFIKFVCPNQGPTCQVRDIQLNAKSYIK